MSSSLYNALALPLLLGAVISLALCVWFAGAAIVGARGPRRVWRLKAMAVSLLLVATCVGAQQFLFWKIFLPGRGQAARAQRNREIEPTSLIRVHDSAPEFSLTETAGNRFSLAEQRGKVVLVNFFATWCGPCRIELPELQKLWDQHRENPEFAMLIIGREETDESLAEFIAETGHTFPIAADPERRAYELYAEQYIPRTYLISREGKVVFASVGFRDDEFQTLVAELSDQLGK